MYETAQTNAEDEKAGQKGTVTLSPEVGGLSHHEQLALPSSRGCFHVIKHATILQ